MRRPLFLIGLAMLAMIAGVGVVVAQTELPPFGALRQATYVCAVNDASAAGTCTPENAMMRLQADHGNRTIISLEEVPDLVVNAVLAMEDRDFYEHDGVNPAGIMRAMFQNVRSRSVQQGGSTITQQYVLNAFELAREGGVARKVKEAVLSIKLEQQMSKDEILEGYLNTIYFGRGAYGVAAASRAYFGIPVQEITDPGHAAFLAGLIRAPNYAEPTERPEEADRRRSTGLVAMVEEGYITQAEADAAEATPVADDVTALTGTVQQTDTLKGDAPEDYLGTDYLAPYIESELRRIDPDRFTPESIRRDGLRVYTSINYDIQRFAMQAVRNNLNLEEDPDAALVAVDDQGLVRAMVASRHSFVAEERENNNAIVGHETGSTFKPITLATALKQGYSLKSRFEAPGSMDLVEWMTEGEPWKVSNYSDGGEAQVMDMIEATAQSSNTAYAQLMLSLGTEPVDSDGDGKTTAKGADSVAALAESMGVGGQEGIPDVNTTPALTLGSWDASPLEMAGVYSTFMNQGRYRQPSIITRVEQVDEDGDVNVLYERQVQETEILTETQANLVTHALQEVAAPGGTGANAALDDRPVAGKTGTSQQNKNAWFCGYTPGMTAAVWMGYPDIVDHDGNPETPDTLMPMNDDGTLVHGRAGTGGSIPATIWHDFMAQASANLSGDFVEMTPEQIETGNIINGDDLRTPDEQPTTTLPPDGPGPDLPEFTIPTRPGRPGRPGQTTTTTTDEDPDDTTTTSVPDITLPTTVPGPDGVTDP